MATGLSVVLNETVLRSIPFTIRRGVRWGEVDSAGIVYTPRFLEYIVETSELWFAHTIGMQWREFHERYQIDTPVVHCNLNFHLPLRVNDQMDLVVEIGRVGNKSYKLRIPAYNKEQEVCFVGEIVVVTVDLVERKSVPLPPNLVARLQAYRKECEEAGSHP